MQKLTLKWLQRHMDFFEKDVIKNIENIDEVLNKKGIEIEDIKLINPFIVVKISEVSREDGLKVCICKTSINEKILKFLPYQSNEIQVLCGASNPKEGMFTVLAPIGTQVGDFLIQERKIKNKFSYGMFCSYPEVFQSRIQGKHFEIYTLYPLKESVITENNHYLNTLTFNENIENLQNNVNNLINEVNEIFEKANDPYILYDQIGVLTKNNENNKEGNENKIQLIKNIPRNDLPDGIIDTDLEEGSIYKIDDVMIKISTPTNRWDLMSVRGIARELCMAGLGELKDLPSCNQEIKYDRTIKVTSDMNINIDFIKVNNISINKEIKILMDRIDEYQISDLKYLNDFVLLDIGHPIHIYDNYGINSIHLRNLKKGEIFTTLKNKEFISDGSEILIENNNKPACIAGIIGIEGFNENTKNVIIEAGYFLPENVNKLNTAAGKLFNLGVDFNQKTMEYLKTLINGDILNIESLNKQQKVNKEIILVYDNIFKISGFAISIKTIKEHLELYGFKCEISRRQRSDSVNNEFIIKCTIPSWRSDIEIEEDIVEEVLRTINIEKYLEKIQINGKVNNNLKYIDIYEDLRNKLINIGFVELYNFPFVSIGEVELSNSLNSEKRFLRKDFIETSTNVVINTLSSGSPRVLAFEINKIYPSEEIRLGIVVCGESQRNWKNKSEQYDLFYLKKVIGELSEIISIDFESIKNLENNKFDYCLEFSNGLLGKYKNINQDRFLDNVFLGEFSISKAKNKENNISQQKKYMDLSVSINKSICFDEISNILTNYKINYYVFDYYPNQNCINYGITLIFDHEELNNEEIYEEIKNRIEKLI